MVKAPLQTRLAVSVIVVAVCCRLVVAAVAGDGLPGWCRDDPSEGETTAETETALMVLDGVLPPALLAALARAAPSIRATMGDSTAWYDLSADEGAAAAAARSVPEEVVRHVAAWLPQLNGSRWAGVEWWVQRRHHAAPPLYLHYDVAGRKRAEARRRRDRGSRSGARASRRPWRGAFTPSVRALPTAKLTRGARYLPRDVNLLRRCAPAACSVQCNHLYGNVAVGRTWRSCCRRSHRCST